MRDAYPGLKLPSERIYVRDATLLRRFAAFAADILLLDLVVLAAFGPLFVGLDFTEALLHGLPPALYAASVVMALLALAYFALFEYLLGQTPGMMLLSIRALNVTLWRAFVRNAFLIPLFPFPLLWVVEPIHLAVRKNRFLEQITETRTIEYISY